MYEFVVEEQPAGGYQRGRSTKSVALVYPFYYPRPRRAFHSATHIQRALDCVWGQDRPRTRQSPMFPWGEAKLLMLERANLFEQRQLGPMFYHAAVFLSLERLSVIVVLGMELDERKHYSQELEDSRGRYDLNHSTLTMRLLNGIVPVLLFDELSTDKFRWWR
ncbi:hypothetical protein BD779DRAFT_1477777 [Infundibulicybe gibba]|nr:hypothetical protein BD779DRAFT_1477777 [Infundibulicybe gibba]